MKRERTKGFITGMLVMALAVGMVGTAAATVGQRAANLEYKDIKITLNGKAVTPTDAQGNVVEPFSIDGTVYLPVRAVGNALGLAVNWDGTTSTAALNGSVANSDGERQLYIARQTLTAYHDWLRVGCCYEAAIEQLEEVMDGILSNVPRELVDKAVDIFMEKSKVAIDFSAEMAGVMKSYSGDKDMEANTTAALNILGKYNAAGNAMTKAFSALTKFESNGFSDDFYNYNLAIAEARTALLEGQNLSQENFSLYAN